MKGVYTRLTLVVSFFALIFLGGLFVMPFSHTIAEKNDEFSDTLVIEYSCVLGHENYDGVYTTESLSNHYGFQFSYSTSPSSTIEVWAFPYDDLFEWCNNLNCDEYQLKTGSTGSGTWRFTSTDSWMIAFWNVGYTTTTLTYSVSVVDLGAPSSGTGDFPWLLVLGAIGVVICIAGTIFVVVKKSKKKQQYPVYSTTRPTFQQTTPFSISGNYGVQTQLENLTKGAMFEMSRGNLNGAINNWNQTLRINPNYYPALAGLGLIYFSVGRFDDAVSFLIKAQRLNPLNPEVNNLLSQAQMQSSQSASNFQFQTENISQPIEAKAYNDDIKENAIEEKMKDFKEGEKICKICEAILKTDDEFCPYCGTKAE